MLHVLLLLWVAVLLRTPPGVLPLIVSLIVVGEAFVHTVWFVSFPRNVVSNLSVLIGLSFFGSILRSCFLC